MVLTGFSSPKEDNFQEIACFKVGQQFTTADWGQPYQLFGLPKLEGRCS